MTNTAKEDSTDAREETQEQMMDAPKTETSSQKTVAKKSTPTKNIARSAKSVAQSQLQTDKADRPTAKNGSPEGGNSQSEAAQKNNSKNSIESDAPNAVEADIPAATIEQSTESPAVEQSDIAGANTADKRAKSKASKTKEAKKSKETSTAKPTKSRSKKKFRFKVGQNVVYPLQGVGRITEQSARQFKGKQVSYYTIYITATDMTVMLPVEKVNELGLRPIVPKDDAEQALKSMSDKNEPLTSDWKLRYQNNLDLLKEGGVMDIATVVRSLYHRSKVKELPILERKLYDNALKLMVDEISLALEREKGEIEDLLHTRLENSNN